DREERLAAILERIPQQAAPAVRDVPRRIKHARDVVHLQVPTARSKRVEPPDGDEPRGARDARQNGQPIASPLHQWRSRTRSMTTRQRDAVSAGARVRKRSTASATPASPDGSRLKAWKPPLSSHGKAANGRRSITVSGSDRRSRWPPGRKYR